ncbi:MAG: transporter [Acidobacteriota bacterium]
MVSRGASIAISLLSCARLASAGDEGAGGIQDNSFLIEEAYNQDPGVVQHINVLTRDQKTHDWIYSLTEEWPAPNLRHQLSYSIPYANVSEGTGRHRGPGDVALNYRYQLVGDADARIALAPRITILAPTGDEARGLGAGGAGLQIGIPVSVVLSSKLVAHANLGATYVPRASDGSGNRAATRSYTAGGSLVLLAASHFNALLEATYASSESVVGRDATSRDATTLVSPGIRWSHDFSNGLQIVPGIAYAFGIGEARGEGSVLLYLSFEHPFRRL